MITLATVAAICAALVGAARLLVWRLQRRAQLRQGARLDRHPATAVAKTESTPLAGVLSRPAVRELVAVPTNHPPTGLVAIDSSGQPYAAVPVEPCDRCGQQMPAGHRCTGRGAIA